MQLFFMVCVICGTTVAIAALYITSQVAKSINKKAVTEFNGTTVPLVPPGAATCEHSWETITNKLIENDDAKKQVIVLNCPLCGAIDKTVEAIDKQCKHSWKTIKDEKLLSGYQQMNEYQQMNLKTIQPWLFRSTLVVLMECEKCGQIHETIASNVSEEKKHV